jgi:FAD/FMN-containing dehydrogenase
MSREVSRQAFVRGALGALAAGPLLGSCRPATEQRPQSTSKVPARDWSALDNSIDGRVVLPSDGDYVTAKSLFNTRFDNSTPAAVVTVMSVADLQKAMSFAVDSGIKIAARSGGHSYIGDSAGNGAMVIDLRQLPGGTSYDEQSGLATISAAAELNSVQALLAAHGRSIPTGSCPTVGVAGLTLGGGLGADSRRSGLTCDALASATVVLPSGEAMTAAPDDHDDLYWALRGGGGGHFGVATSFTFRTYPVADREVVTLVFPEARAAQAISGWHAWLTPSDRANWGMVNITVSSSGMRCSVVLATAAGAGSAAADDVSAAVGVGPVSKNIETLNHMDFVNYFAGGADATRPRAVVAGSDVIGDMTPAAADSIVAAASARPQTMGSVTAVIESLGGAVNDVDPGGSAFPWRRQAACIQWYTEPTSPASVDAANDWLASAHDAVRAQSVGGYVNYVEAGVPAARYFADNLARLAVIQQKYDPHSSMYSSVSF